MDNVLERMQQDRGYLYATHEFLARHDPEFLAEYNRIVGTVLLHESVVDGAAEPELDMPHRELLVSCVLASRGAAIESIAAHLRRALDGGMSLRAVLEGFQAVIVPGGAPTMMQGIRALMLIEETDGLVGRGT